MPSFCAERSVRRTKVYFAPQQADEEAGDRKRRAFLRVGIEP